ncbi:MAG TPA: 4-hydroxyphenylpyruvate dioxygenase [candidate division Zixibacteria bacterium]|nr:4-hydroxyphenylpyruvate dioxygenase [candidate division Zixibacteria bacterium]MDD4916196.1 4-hydroxyphenylpyruvate dioxygenase [candidate division Zixibacteria bacterium]MDM7972363.1 4-hydroxyphenylpyruvate dioxygenase [candidate division Zixibacteria bacterium]HOD67746.1 4-hydroxyphenylpyruvate dioxygenase [candidate division Zixibacteria bacterium]HPM37501.1 4-hydroxyphenylpyruvate dioxygenase [candidate division Zixibacteria bacterium]
MSSPLGIRGYDYVEFYVGSARMTAFWFARALGLQLTGYAGPETGVRDRISFYLTRHRLKFVVTSPLQPDTWDIWGWITKHGDGVKRWAVEVDSVEDAFAYAAKRGAVMVKRPERISNRHGYIDEAAIRLYDDTELVYVNRDHYRHIFRPGFCEPLFSFDAGRDDTGLLAVDHIVGNVRENEMNLWAEYFNNTMDFETFVDFGPGDISTRYSSLLSKVVRSKDSKIRNPINEPYEGLKKSQIEEFIEQYRGSGIQHVALRTGDIVATVSALRRNGVEFLAVPDAYYDRLRGRSEVMSRLREDLALLKQHGILCDIESDGYLLQLFTKPIGDRPTFFFEVIQRVGNSEGFGKGNFQALFESIELDQKLRGNLEKDKVETAPIC